MWDTTCQCGDNCQCKNQTTWTCGCHQTDDSATTWAAYGAGDTQDIEFTATDIAKLNEMFGEMDLSSDGDDDGNIDILEKNLEWMKEKFGNKDE